jgi:hypothetical protein
VLRPHPQPELGERYSVARIGESGDLCKCSFCGKSQKQVRRMIAGPGVYICDECVGLCLEIMDEEGVPPNTRAASIGLECGFECLLVDWINAINPADARSIRQAKALLEGSLAELHRLDKLTGLVKWAHSTPS